MSVTLGGIPLTIGDILKALKQGKQLADIGKELTIGKEKLSKALKEAGYTFSRRTGWTFAGTGEAPLNQAYTDFVESSRGSVTHAQKEVVATTENIKASNNQRTNVRTNERTNVGSKVGLNEQTKERKNEPSNELTKEPTNVGNKVVRKRSSFDIDVELMKDLKIQAVIHGKNVYEIVENAIRRELAELKKGN